MRHDALPRERRQYHLQNGLNLNLSGSLNIVPNLQQLQGTEEPTGRYNEGITSNIHIVGKLYRSKEKKNV